jgi:hypothetical protein
MSLRHIKNKFKFKMKKQIISLIAVMIFGLGMFVTGGYLVTQNDAVFGAIAGANLFTSPSNTAFTCGPDSQVAIATSTAAMRVYTALTNNGSTNIYLGLGEQATSSMGLRLNSGGGSYEILPENLFTGPIFCYASASTSLLIVNK